MANSKELIGPFGQRFLIKLTDQVEITKGGIVIPGSAQDRATEGIVVAIGCGRQDTTFTGKWPPFKVGQKVLVGKWAGQEITIEDTGEKLWLIGIDELLATLRSLPGSKDQKESPSSG